MKPNKTVAEDLRYFREECDKMITLYGMIPPDQVEKLEAWLETKLMEREEEKQNMLKGFLSDLQDLEVETDRDGAIAGMIHAIKKNLTNQP